MIERVNPPELGTPRGFSHAVVGTGKVVLLAGQTALDPEGRIVGEDVVEQFEQARNDYLTRMRDVLPAAGVVALRTQGAELRQQDREVTAARVRVADAAR